MTFPAKFEYKTEPFPHQREELEQCWKRRSRALFWEMGTGKSKPVLDNAAAVYHAGAIDALVIIATNGVHRGWVEDEIPKHLPDNVNPKVMVWDSKRSGTKVVQREFTELLAHRDGLPILTMSYHAVNTKAGLEALKKILDVRKCFLVADESAHIKTPSAQWTKKLTGQGKKWRGVAEKAVMRRIMTGTPVTKSPFDLYSQLRFLNQEIWNEYGIYGWAEYKAHYGVFEKGFIRSGNTMREFPKLVEYRNLDQLEAVMNHWGSRVLKSDVFPDLPPKMYQKRRFELPTRTRQLYTEMREKYRIEIASGDGATAIQPMVRVTRLHQIACGNIPTEDGTVDIESLGEGCARMDALLEIIDEIEDQQMIIWAHFRDDTKRIMKKLTDRGIKAVLHDGGVKAEDREKNIKAFRSDPSIKCFVATPATLSEGRTLTEATTVVYYSQSFNLKDRLQSEDRCHRAGQHNAVLYIDIVANDTVDDRIINSLRDKKNVANLITGDTVGEWI